MATKKKPAKGTKKAAGKPAARQIEWTRNRGKQPVADGVWVEVRLRSGELERSPAEEFRWHRVGLGSVGDDQDIMAWRRVRKPRAERKADEAREARKARTLEMLAASRPADDDFITVRDCITCAHDSEDFSRGTRCGDCLDSKLKGGELDGWEPKPAAEPVRHFDRSDEPKRPYTDEISHPLADQLDPTTPARPVWDEHIDGDRDGLGCARGVVWSVVGILAVAALACLLRWALS